MATINATLGSALVPQLGWQKFVIEKLLDFTVLKPAANDVIQAINVVEGMLVERVRTMVIVAGGATLTFDVGDGVDPNGFDDAVDGNASAKTLTNMGSDAYLLGRYYTENDTIDITLDHANSTAKILLIAEGCYIQNPTVHTTV